MRLKIIAAVLVCAGFTQVAAAPAIEQAYEVRVQDLTLPANEFGSVILRECASCDLVTLRVEGETTYRFQDRILPLREFRAAVLNMKDRDEAMATVVSRIKDGRVRMVAVVAAPETSDGPKLNR